MAVYGYSVVLRRQEAYYYIHGKVSSDGTGSFALCTFMPQGECGGGYVGQPLLVGELRIVDAVTGQRIQDAAVRRAARHLRCAPRFVEAVNFRMTSADN